VRLLIFILCAFWSLGCSSSRTVTVHVVDAETGAPIPNALIHTYRHEHWPWWAQELVKTYRAPDGTARVRAIKDPLGYVSLGPEAPGYLPYWATDAYADGTPAAETRITELKPWPFKEVTLTLYREPEPRVELIIPDGYRGLVHVAMPVSCRPQMNGKRVFEVPFQPGTIAMMPALPGDDLRIRSARRAGGQELLSRKRSQIRPEDVILRHVWAGHLPRPHVRRGEGENVWIVRTVRAEQYMEVYVVGTEEDQRRERWSGELRRPFGGPPPVATAPAAP
jgi:hypothetical protein